MLCQRWATLKFYKEGLEKPENVWMYWSNDWKGICSGSEWMQIKSIRFALNVSQYA